MAPDHGTSQTPGSRDASASLRDAVLSNLPITGNLRTGEPYEILLSRKSAVTDGVHLILSMNIPADELPSAKRTEAFGILIDEIEKFELARVFGYRLSCNAGKLLTRPHFHIQAIIPGSTAEVEAAPRLIDPWPVERV